MQQSARARTHIEHEEFRLGARKQVGDHTLGRGVIQTIFPLGVGAVRLTTAHFQSARGEQFEGKGLRPDIEVSDFVEAANFGSENDPVLRAAIDRLKR